MNKEERIKLLADALEKLRNRGYKLSKDEEDLVTQKNHSPRGKKKDVR